MRFWRGLWAKNKTRQSLWREQCGLLAPLQHPGGGKGRRNVLPFPPASPIRDVSNPKKALRHHSRRRNYGKAGVLPQTSPPAGVRKAPGIGVGISVVKAAGKN